MKPLRSEQDSLLGLFVPMKGIILISVSHEEFLLPCSDWDFLFQLFQISFLHCHHSYRCPLPYVVTVQYCSKVSWKSWLNSWNLILALWRLRRSICKMWESRVQEWESRIKSWRNEELCNMHELELVQELAIHLSKKEQ